MTDTLIVSACATVTEEHPLLPAQPWQPLAEGVAWQGPAGDWVDATHVDIVGCADWEAAAPAFLLGP